MIIEQGLFRGESRHVRFNFSHADFVAAFESYVAGGHGSLPKELRIYAHELTHAICYATTPYGLFLHYCRDAQARIVGSLVKTLLAHDKKPVPPLLATLPALPGETGQHVATWLSMWLNIEFLVTQLSNIPKMHENLLRRVQSECLEVHPPLLPISETIWGVQKTIANNIDYENTQRTHHNLPLWDQAGFDHHVIDEAIRTMSPSFDRSLERAEELLLLLENPWSVDAILESAAMASEFTRSGMNLDELRAWVAAPCDPALAVYRSCLQRGLEVIPATDLPQFLFSYLALCELCLFAPLLPQHAALRGPGFPLEQLLPVTRFQRLLGAAENISPMLEIRDHARYVTDLCQHLGWVHPLQIISTAVRGAEVVADPRAQVYINAQRFRGRNLSCYLDATSLVLETSAYGASLRDSCTFIVVEHTDKTIFHHDTVYLKAMTIQHLFSQMMRCIVLGSDFRVASPYRCDDHERHVLTIMLRESLQNAFGFDFLMAQVV